MRLTPSNFHQVSLITVDINGEKMAASRQNNEEPFVTDDGQWYIHRDSYRSAKVGAMFLPTALRDRLEHCTAIRWEDEEGMYMAIRIGETWAKFKLPEEGVPVEMLGIDPRNTTLYNLSDDIPEGWE